MIRSTLNFFLEKRKIAFLSEEINDLLDLLPPNSEKALQEEFQKVCYGLDFLELCYQNITFWEQKKYKTTSAEQEDSPKGINRGVTSKWMELKSNVSPQSLERLKRIGLDQFTPPLTLEELKLQIEGFHFLREIRKQKDNS